MQFHILVAPEEDALIVVVDGHGQGNLGLLLSDDVLAQHVLNLPGDGQLVGNLIQGGGVVVVKIVVEDAHTEVDALVADADAGTLNHAVDLLLMLAAEGAADGFSAIVTHRCYLGPSLFPGNCPRITCDGKYPHDTGICSAENHRLWMNSSVSESVLIGGTCRAARNFAARQDAKTQESLVYFQFSQRSMAAKGLPERCGTSVNAAS